MQIADEFVDHLHVVNNTIINDQFRLGFLIMNIVILGCLGYLFMLIFVILLGRIVRETLEHQLVFLFITIVFVLSLIEILNELFC